MRELLEHGANVHAVDTQGRTALHHAVALEKQVFVKLLLIFGANANRYHVYVHNLSRACSVRFCQSHALNTTFPLDKFSEETSTAKNLPRRKAASLRKYTRVRSQLSLIVMRSSTQQTAQIHRTYCDDGASS